MKISALFWSCSSGRNIPSLSLSLVVSTVSISVNLCHLAGKAQAGNYCLSYSVLCLASCLTHSRLSVALGRWKNQSVICQFHGRMLFNYEMNYVFQTQEQISFRVMRKYFIHHGFWPFPQANSTSLIVKNLATQKELIYNFIILIWGRGCWPLCDYDENHGLSQTKEYTDKILYTISVGSWTQ